jgi:transposase
MTSMPHTGPPRDEVVLGVDTHKDFHAAVAITDTGVYLGGRQFPATWAGYAQLIGWAQGLGRLRRAGVEGTGSYGAGLARALRAAGIEVADINRPDRATRRRQGKTDLVDAEAAARTVLAGKATVVPKTGDGTVETMRIIKIAKDSAVKAQIQAINQLKAILVTADPALREPLEPLSRAKLLHHCAELDPAGHHPVTAAAICTLRLLARRAQYLGQEIRSLQRQLTHAVGHSAPRLLDLDGIGPDTAATLLITAGDNPHRLRSEGSFAALCGVSPVEASSGKTRRHRLNRGGDRQANAALYMATLTNLRWNPHTQAYKARRTTEGMSTREIIRCLKRYLARSVYRIIREAIPTPA